LHRPGAGDYARAVGSVFRVAALAALIALAGCSQAPAPPAAKLWTLFDVQTLYANGATAAKPLAPDDGLPGGIPLGDLSDGMGLVGHVALADGYQTTFVTTEVWSNYPQVWMQPAYVPVTGWVDGLPTLLGGPPWHPIFSVGPESGFYSPFWQIVYAQVPADAVPGTFTSAKQILDGGYPLTPSQGETLPLIPSGFPTVPGPGPGESASAPPTGWWDGAKISFLNFGAATFSWDEANVVQEIPFYVFTVEGADGQPHAPAEIFPVLGTVPFGTPVQPPDPNTQTSAPTIDGVARYVAYWRVYTVPVPSFATVFAPPGTDLANELTAAGDPPTGQYSDTFTGYSATELAPYLGMVAIDKLDPATGLPACFASVGVLEGCTWLESQQALQDNLDLSAAQSTGITFAGPVTQVRTTPVKPL